KVEIVVKIVGILSAREIRHPRDDTRFVQAAVGQAQGLGVFIGRRADPAVPIGEAGRAGPHDADAHAALRGFGKVVGDLVFTLCAAAHAGAPQEIPHAAGERVGVAGDVVGISARVFGGESVGSDQI